MFGFSSIRLGIIAAIVATVGLVALKAWNARYDEGRSSVFIEVEQRNRDAEKAADKVKTTVHGCFDSGGSWNVATGTCIRRD